MGTYLLETFLTTSKVVFRQMSWLLLVEELKTTGSTMTTFLGLLAQALWIIPCSLVTTRFCRKAALKSCQRTFRCTLSVHRLPLCHPVLHPLYHPVLHPLYLYHPVLHPLCHRHPLCHPRSLHLCHPRSLHLCHPRSLHLCHSTQPATISRKRISSAAAAIQQQHELPRSTTWVPPWISPAAT